MTQELGHFRKAEVMEGPKGTVKNHMIITTSSGRALQSYTTLVAAKLSDGRVLLDKVAWNHSRTTAKYRNMFLGMTTAEITKGMREGAIRVVHLN